MAKKINSHKVLKMPKLNWALAKGENWEWAGNVKNVRFFYTGVLLLVMLAFLLGIAYGVSSEQKQFIDTFIPVLSTVG